MAAEPPTSNSLLPNHVHPIEVQALTQLDVAPKIAGRHPLGGSARDAAR